MRLLVYGFGPYREFRDNVTEKIVKALPRQRGLRTVVFPVRFYRWQFIEALEEHKPDKVIGLGQCPREQIQVETTARNRKRARKTNRTRPIKPTGPSSLPTTLQLKLGRQVVRSSNAGDYVCNYSMYVMLDYLSRNRPDVQFGFLHIPQHSNLLKSTALVTRAIKKLKQSAS